MPSDDEYGAFHAEFEAVSGDVLNVPAARDMFRHGWKAGRAFEAYRLAASLAREARLRAIALRAADYHTMNAQAYHETYGGDERDPGLFVPELIAAAAPAAGGQPRDGEEA